MNFPIVRILRIGSILGIAAITCFAGAGSVQSFAASSDIFSFRDSTYCYPNPARGDVSHIQVYAARAAEMDMVLYDDAEQPILRVSRNLSPGAKYTLDWDLTNVAEGVYLAVVRVTYSDGSVDRKTMKIGVVK